MHEPLERRVARIRQRCVVRSWEYRQRNLAHGCWGKLKGLRSIRLSRGYRAYYRSVKDAVEFVRVERVDKHGYSTHHV
jgi:hypothetical protein